MRIMLQIAIMSVAASLALQASGAVVRVPGDQPTIQAGVDVAAPGDTVLVAPGIYRGPGNRDVDLLGKDLTILSENGSGETTIDCEGSPTDPHRAFCIVGGGTRLSVVIQGFTIRNGRANDSRGGGGIFCSSAALTLVDCILRDNTAGPPVVVGRGGGVYCENSTVTVADCVFRGNTAGSWVDDYYIGYGGGVYCDGCSGLFRGCAFEYNFALYSGGGVYGGWLSDLTFRSCTFTGNRVGDLMVGGGAGLCGRGTFEDVVFSGNVATGFHAEGGGVYGGGTFKNVAFIGNTAGGAGGLHGVGELNVTDCVFSGNRSRVHGPGAIQCAGGTFENLVVSWNMGPYAGGIKCHGDATFTNATIVRNDNSESGASAVACYGSPVFKRTIIAHGYGDSPVVACFGSANPTFECCDVFGNEGGDWIGCIADQYGVNGNICADPLFCGVSAEDFTLQGMSPCAPANNSCGVLIGAFGIGCNPTSVMPTTWGGIKAMFH